VLGADGCCGAVAVVAVALALGTHGAQQQQVQGSVWLIEHPRPRPAIEQRTSAGSAFRGHLMKRQKSQRLAATGQQAAFPIWMVMWVLR
jgi:hypothetical protein